MTESEIPGKSVIQIPELSQWRTWSGGILIGAMMVAVLLLCPPEMRAGVAPAVIGGLGAIALGLAAKSYGEHKANTEVAIKAPATADVVLKPKEPQ